MSLLAGFRAGGLEVAAIVLQVAARGRRLR
jgi:hypothetical protein